MPATLEKSHPSKPVQSLDSVRPRMAKVDSGPIRRALIKACGSMKAAAISMRIDQSQLNRELESEHFNLLRVNALSALERSAFYAQMHEESAPLDTPKLHMMRLCY